MPRKRDAAQAGAHGALAQQQYGWVVIEEDPWRDWPDAPAASPKLPRKSRRVAPTTDNIVVSTEVKKRLSKIFQGLVALRADQLDLVEALIEKLAADDSSGRHRVPAAPAQAPELFSKRSDRAEAIPAFVQRVYGPYLDGKYFTVATLRKLDGPAAGAVIRYRMQHEWPADVDLPTLPEANERLIAAGRIEELRALMQRQQVLTHDELLELRRLQAVRSKSRGNAPD